MLTYEFKLRGKPEQFAAMDEAIRTIQFIRNKAVRYWMDHRGTGKYDLSKLGATLAAEFPFADKLNSTARQQATERAWSAISNFFDNCSDAGWSMLKEWIQYFATLFGKVCILVEPEYSTQECHACGQREPKALSQRWHNCPCGCKMDRD